MLPNCKKLLFLCVCLFFYVAHSVEAKEQCKSDQYEFQYTQCDEKGQRWRVSVPKTDDCEPTADTCTNIRKAQACNFECKSGQYLNVNSQTCENCPAGTYSSGSSARFTDWESLPMGFSTFTEAFSGWDSDQKTQNCSSYAWTPKGSYVAVVPSSCQADLIYSVSLVKAGKLVFEYQFPDQQTLFHVKVQNDQCQSSRDKDSSKWPENSNDGTWGTIQMDLKSGFNVITWHVIGIESTSSAASPILLKNIRISGVAYTSDCTKCPAGTYSSQGSTLCTDCQINTKSEKGATICQQCDVNTQYSLAGATECKDKPACTESDYYHVMKPCENKKTATTYQWIQPMICNPDLAKSIKLPVDSALIDCLTCNPGMHLVNQTCTYCPPNHRSDGTNCLACEANTAPDYGYMFENWNGIPTELDTTCISFSDVECSNDTKWLAYGDHLETHFARGESAYLIIQIKVNGFRTQRAVGEGGSTTVGHLKLEFETDCDSFCQLVLLSDESGKQDVINSWDNLNKQKKHFIYDIKQNGSYTFTLAFQNSGWLIDSNIISKSVAKIYAIEVTNTMGGGAKTCRKCPKGTNQGGCIPCPDGNYIDKNTTSCIACPPHTVVDSHSAYGAESCKACGRGLAVYKGSMCISDGKYEDEDGHNFDLRNISNGFQFVQGNLLFTSSGTQYYHGFNISLFGPPDKSYVICQNNVTKDVDSHSVSHAGKPDITKALHEPTVLRAKICRTTLVPALEEVGSVMTTQSTSLGDELVEVVRNQSDLGVDNVKWTTFKGLYEDSGFDVADVDRDIQVHFKASSPTRACPNGRHTLISLRCDPDKKGQGEISLPPKCPDGTCDGCTFHFMWFTKLACPICKIEDFKRLEGACIKGYQAIHFIQPKHCIVPEELADYQEKKECTMLLASLPIVFQIAVPVVIGLVAICFFVACFLWRKNKKLEYRYMKLVENSGSGEGELPAADSCGLEEDEEEGGDSVTIRSSKGARFFKKLTNKIKKIGSSDLDDDAFESAVLNERMPLT